MSRARRVLLALPILALLIPAAAQAQGNATIYEIQQGVYSQFTFVTCDSVVVTGVGDLGFFVAEQGGGAQSGIFVNYGQPPTVIRGDLVTVGGYYIEDADNSILSASPGIGGVVSLQTQGAALPTPEPLATGDLNTASPTAELWEGCYVQLDSVTNDGALGGRWQVSELDGDTPGELLIVDTLLNQNGVPAVGDTIVTLTGLIHYDGSDFLLEPRDDLDILVADNIPPSAVSDLAAATGVYGGEVDLDWSAVGDDGLVGTALAYTVRYANDSITDATWGSANDVFGEPLPAVSGTPQSMTVQNLTPGQVYWFALRVQDEFGNVSGISNSDSAMASTNAEFAYSVVFGNFHSHTGLSDGTGSLDDAYTHARDVANIDVLSVTDHSHYVTTSEYNSMLSAAATYTDDGNFVALVGQEMGIANSSGYGHMSVWNASQVAPTSAFTNLTNAYNFLLTEGVPGGYNHPEPMNGGSNFNNLAYVFQYDSNVQTIEVRNGKRSGNYHNRYVQALQNGWHIGAVANQDNHNGLWGDQQNPSSGNDIYLTALLVNDLTTNDVLDAIWNRRTYACEINPANDRQTILYKGGGLGDTKAWMGAMDTVTTMSIELELDASASTAFQTVQIYRDGNFLTAQSVSGNNVQWDYTDVVPTNAVEYSYFLRILQADGDAVWTSPIWFYVDTTLTQTDVALGDGAPARLTLHQNSPNPFNPITSIAFEIPLPGKATLEVYDVAGRLVRTLVDDNLAAGEHEVTWDGSDNLGRSVGSGLYFYEIRSSGKREHRKMMLVR